MGETILKPMRTKWRGDAAHMLPAQNVEPYRLWFEFLKLGSRDPDIQNDKRFYRRIGASIPTHFCDESISNLSRGQSRNSR